MGGSWEVVRIRRIRTLCVAVAVVSSPTSSQEDRVGVNLYLDSRRLANVDPVQLQAATLALLRRRRLHGHTNQRDISSRPARSIHADSKRAAVLLELRISNIIHNPFLNSQTSSEHRYQHGREGRHRRRSCCCRSRHCCRNSFLRAVEEGELEEQAGSTTESGKKVAARSDVTTATAADRGSLWERTARVLPTAD